MKHTQMGKSKITVMLLSLSLTACASSSINNYSNNSNQLAANYNVQLGLAYLKQGDASLAKEKLILASQQAPSWSETQDAMGYFFEETGEPETAKKYYEKAINLSPHNGAILNDYGVFLCRQRQPELAEKMFLKATQQENYLYTAQAYENAGLCALTIPDKNKAKKYFEKALLANPHLQTSQQELKQLHE